MAETPISGKQKNIFDRLLENPLILLFCLIEVACAAALFFGVVAIILWLHQLVGHVSPNDDPAAYWFIEGGKLLLMAADALIVLLFVTKGVQKTWLETWGKAA